MKLRLFMRKFPLMILLPVLLLILSTGCRKRDKEILTSTPIKIQNVYTHPSYDHASITNLFVLPIENTFNTPGVELHRESLTNALIRSLGKFNYFNVQFDPEIDRQISGPVIDLMTGGVDRNTLGQIGQLYNAQAAMKVSVTDHSPFPPMRLRIKGAVVDTQTAETIWSFDQVFDTDDVQVIDSMRQWWNGFRSGSDEEQRFQISKIRPSFFYNYAFFKYASTYGATRSKNVEAFAELEEREHKGTKHDHSKRYKRDYRGVYR